MKRTKKLKYMLVDGIERNENHPDTFWIPSEKAKNSLIVGDMAKLGFLDKDGSGERMWVEIIEKDKDSFKGTLSNQPVFLKLTYGDEVSFESKHIIDHCHTTGKIRGLLCTNCNNMLGKAKDNVEVLKKAISYLEQTNHE